MNKQRCRVSLHWPLMKASDDEGHAGRKPTGTTQCASFHLLLFLLLFPIPSPYPFSFSLSLFLSCPQLLKWGATRRRHRRRRSPSPWTAPASSSEAAGAFDSVVLHPPLSTVAAASPRTLNRIVCFVCVFFSLPNVIGFHRSV